MPGLQRVPRDLVARLEARPAVPIGPDDRFAGYAVLGVTFAAGEVLALRRFPASSIGPGYSSVWHRSPEGRWVFYQDVVPGLGCARYFGLGVRAVITPIRIVWTAGCRFTVLVDDGLTLQWEVELRETRLTRALNRLAGRVPARLLTHSTWADGLGRVSGRLLGAGRLRLSGSTPSGHRFLASPADIWLVSRSRATIHGRPTGDARRSQASRQIALGDFVVPRRGLFTMAVARMRGPSP